MNGKVKYDIFVCIDSDKIKDGRGEACQYRSPSWCAQITNAVPKHEQP